jgi:hypothetical protein
MGKINNGYTDGDEHYLFKEIYLGVAFVIAVSQQSG